MDVDGREATRREELKRLLRLFNITASHRGAKPHDVVGALMENAAQIYALELSGARGDKERKKAKAAFIRTFERAFEDLPTAAEDAEITAALARQGLA